MSLNSSDRSAPAVWPLGEVLRDIARGGIAGIIVGLLVAGLGGRLIMRLATILHEDTVGLRTENGEVIGNITLNGTLALMTFGGLGMGLMAGTIWVIVSPWIPDRGLARAFATATAAIALGTPSLIQRTNPDFFLLGYDPIVVVLLIGLVGLVGFSIALVDGALDARLPRSPRAIGISTTVYLIVTLLGLVLIVPLVVAILLDQPDYAAPIRAGWALAVVGACTFTWWVLRVRGRSTPPTSLRLAAAGSLLIAVVFGFMTGLPHILGAAGLS
ncbi:MAG TPA: hypothetical protein VHK05_05210 [Candidatus Limnocylindrales bacterium]|jgi:hypothetical protein|nr:hypothetical protein [Candidatus Limnocylindrales bacterium]